MGTTKRDFLEVFTTELRPRRSRRVAGLDKVFQLGPKGITFVTNTFVPEWTEVGVEMCLPTAGTRKEQNIGCRGVIVQCARCDQGKGFEVSLLFIDLPKRAQSQLSDVPAVVSPSCISISR